MVVNYIVMVAAISILTWAAHAYSLPAKLFQPDYICQINSKITFPAMLAVFPQAALMTNKFTTL
jgi:hypothetical protein